jgi:hypothetical protein
LIFVRNRQDIDKIATYIENIHEGLQAAAGKTGFNQFRMNVLESGPPDGNPEPCGSYESNFMAFNQNLTNVCREKSSLISLVYIFGCVVCWFGSILE